MTLNLLIGADAEALLGNQAFQQQWRSLYSSCPWATIFQGADFVTIWYEIYRSQFQPLLITETLADGSLGGLLTLAITPDSQQLLFAGAKQAEYHTWLATADRGDLFIAAAMDLLRASFAGLTLTFEYLPPLAPKQWLAADQPWANQSRIVPWTRPLMQLGDGENLRKSLKKSANKSRLNRLKRLGEVEFEQLHGVPALAAVFDRIIAYYDFRQGAVNDSVYFQADPLRQSFYLALMAVPDLLHVTVLKVADLVVAAHLGLSDGKQCGLGIPAHSPFYAIHSPGKLQLLMLGVELAKQGFETLDLTPGGDPYKERFATDRDEVHILTIFLSDRTLPKQLAELKVQSKSIFKTMLRGVKIDPTTAEASLRQLRRLRLRHAIDWSKSSWQQQQGGAEQLYCYSADPASTAPDGTLFNRDCLEDLLLFQPVDLVPTRQEFLSLCLSRLEAGHHVYTLVEQGHLRSTCWLVERQEQPADELEPASALIYDYSVYPTSQPPDYTHLPIQQVVNDALLMYGAKQVQMTVRANDPLRGMIEKTGFTRVTELCDEA